MEEPKPPPVQIGTYSRFPDIDDWIEKHGGTWESGLQGALDVNLVIDTDALLEATLTESDFTTWIAVLRDVRTNTHWDFVEKRRNTLDRDNDDASFMSWIGTYADELSDVHEPEELSPEQLELVRDAARKLRTHGKTTTFVWASSKNATAEERFQENERRERGDGIRSARIFLAAVRLGIVDGFWQKLSRLKHASSGYTGNDETDLSRDFGWSLYTDSGDFYGDGVVFIDNYRVLEPYSSREATAFLETKAQWSTSGGDSLSNSDVGWVPLRWWAKYAQGPLADADDDCTEPAIFHADESGERWIVVRKTSNWNGVLGAANITYWTEAL